MRVFRRLVLECFYKQKTTKITLNFPKIIEMHLNSSSQCTQLAMRQAFSYPEPFLRADRQINEKKTQLRQREKNSNSFALTLGLNPGSSHFSRAMYEEDPGDEVASQIQK